MSDQPQPTPPSAPAEEASGIIQQMQTLVDVEAGLADAHLAVKSGADGSTDASAAAAHTDGDADAAGDDDAFLEAAEEVEDALESSIPAPPPAPFAAGAGPTTPAETLLPGFGNTSTGASTSISTAEAPAAAGAAAAVSTDTSTDTPADPAVVEAEHAIEAVNADIPEPVLPAQVTQPAHDVQMETAIEEETSPMQIDTLPAAPVAQEQAEDADEEPPRRRYDPSEPQGDDYIPVDPSSSSSATRSSHLEPVAVPPVPAPAPVRYDPSEPQGMDLEPVYDPTVPQQQNGDAAMQDKPEPARVKYDPSEPQDSTPVSYDPTQPQAQSAQTTPIAVDPRLAAIKQEVPPSAPSAHAPAAPPAFDDAPVVKSELPSATGEPVASSSSLAGPAPPFDARPLADLPDGINDDSPSVKANAGWTRAWRLGEPLLMPMIKQYNSLCQTRRTRTLFSAYSTGVCKSPKSTMQGHGTP